MDVVEDVNRIGVQGFAGDQLVSLYRYYRKLTTPAGRQVSYSDDEVATLQAFRLGIPADKSLFATLSSTKLRLQLATDVGLPVPEGAPGPSVIPRGAPLIVTGHSLGGHLALLFGRVFPDVTEYVYTYNAPGIGIQGELALRMLGLPPNSPATVTNIASELGAEAVSRIWSKPGENIGIATEPGHPLYEHSIVPLADALAVYGAIAELSPSLATGHATISGIISAASPFPEQSLEVVLDDLRAALGSEGAPTQVATTLADLGARDNFYENLYALLDGRQPGHDYRIASLVGKSAGEIAALAATDVSVRFALHELHPFAAAGADYSAFEDGFSGQWLASRAEWLAASLEGNLVDRPFGLTGDADNVLFRDVDAGLQFSKLNGAQGILAMQALPLADRSRLQDVLDAVPYNRAVVFGSDSTGPGDAISGLTGGDRLFGGAGDDYLEGLGGDDYLEGGSGVDTLNGSEGDDMLSGGEGGDRLEGGAGHDAYLYGEGLDGDTIVDRDGAIHAGATQLTGGSRDTADAPYQSSDGRFEYAFSGDLSTGGTLVVNGTLRVEGFRDGDLGIHLVDGTMPRPVPQAPQAEASLLGDYEYVPIRVSPTVVIDLDEYGNPWPETRADALPGLQDTYEVFPGTPGNTRFVMGAGNDNLQAMLGGDDHLELGEGDDAAFGGEGDDFIEGGPGRDVLAGGRGDDVVYAGSPATNGSSEPGGNLLSGGDGNDALIGGAGADLIEGGVGLDAVLGGAGDDWIGSDVGALAARERYDIHPPNNDWINRSVDLLWGLSAPPTFELLAPGYPGAPGRARLAGTEINAALTPNVGDDDEIDAGAGNDTIYAAGGNDRVFGGDGDDWISAGGGDDLVFGGAGSDFIDPGAGADVVIAGDGDDFVQNSFDEQGDYVDGGSGNDNVYGGPGDDILIGGDGDDRMGSSGGSDVLLGGAGNDFLGASGGSPVIDGGAGDDMLGVRAASDGVGRVRVGRGSGADILEAQGGPVVVEVLGDLAPQEVSVGRGERMIPARDGEGDPFETLSGIEMTLGAGGDSLFLVDMSPAQRAASLQIEFADGTVWDASDLEALLAPAGETGGGGSSGGAGDDLYAYAPGDGVVDIADAAGAVDVLRLAEGIEAQALGVYARGTDFILDAGFGGVRIRGGRTAERAIERVEFADGSAWSVTDLEARAEVLPDNSAPAMPASLGRFSVDPGTPLAIVLPEEAGRDADRFDTVSLHALTADGERLPEWLQFDAGARTLSGTPDAAVAGAHELFLVAVDSSGAASVGALTIAVGGDVPVPVPESGSGVALAAGESSNPIAIDTLPSASASASAAGAGDVPGGVLQVVDIRAELERTEGVPIEAFLRGTQEDLEMPLLVGRANLADRYLEAIREFEERRLEREAPAEPPLPDEEVEAWNSAMHDWHERHPGFGEADLGGDGGSWALGWGLPGTGEAGLGRSSVSTPPGLGSPGIRARLEGVARAPALSEGLGLPS